MLYAKDVMRMFKRLMALLLCLMMAAAALAEKYTTLRYAPELTGLPANLSWRVYTGPGENYHVAADGKAKVSTNEAIQCYGRVEGTNWLMIRYFIDQGKSRVGYICVNSVAYAETFEGVETLHFQNELYSLKGRVEITDDPYLTRRTIGTASGVVTLLAVKSGGDWAYIEGHLDGSGEPVRGFIRRTALNGAAPLPDMALSSFAGDRFEMEKSTALKLADGAQAEDMALYPLADGSWLISYRCGDDGRLYLRVISEEGRKLWAKSLDRRYLHQITLTEDGFICETFDNSECDSGMRYTYTCKGRKWTGKKVDWINEPDRAYADNTASFTLLRHTFGEGGQPMPIEVINRVNGATLLSETHTFKPFLCEMDGSLLLLDEAADGTLALRIFSADLTDVTRVIAPSALADRWSLNIRTADHARNAVYFFTGYGKDWHIWRFDRETLTFAEEATAIAVPQSCTLTALGANAAGIHDVLMETDFGAYFCQLEPDGTLLLHQSLPGRVAWITRMEDGRLMLILQDSNGDFHLQTYLVCEG